MVLIGDTLPLTQDISTPGNDRCVVKRPSIKDVAREAGCSVSTVSLVVNERGNVSDETRGRVMKVVRDLGYHATRAARGLASKTSGNIGFILRDDHFSQAEPFYTRVFLGAEFAARDHNFYVLLATVSHQFSDKKELPRFLLERNVDGVIIAGKVSQRFIDQVEAFGIPIVLVDFEVRRKRYASILIDNKAGARAAVEHLLACGHRDIAFVGGDIAHPSLADRLQGYRDTLTDHGILVQDRLIDTREPDSRITNGASAMGRLLEQRPLPTAVFAANDATAIGCIQKLREHGLSIPGQVAVVGFDDIEMSSLMHPRLTTLRVFKEELGRQAVNTLVDMIHNKETVVVTKHFPVELIVRESSCTPVRAKDGTALQNPATQ
jgi:LacI family transcriptional regulator